YFVFDRKHKLPVELARKLRASAADAQPVEIFALDRTPDVGSRLVGRLTRPKETSNSTPPLLVWLPDAPARTHDQLGREAQAWAAMGFAVLEVEHRGVSGYGRAHLEAAREALDRVPLEDIEAAIAW